MADVVVAATAQKEIDALPRPIAMRVGRLLERLRLWPKVSGAKPLRGKLAGKYRMRTGDYRVQFHVEKHVDKDEATGREKVRHTITIEKAGHRDGFYE